MERIRNWLLHKIETDKTVQKFQKLCGVKKDKGNSFTISSKALHLYFTIGSLFGYELFYMLFFSYLAWNDSISRTVRLVALWATTNYIAHAIKDTMRLPRPNAPDVVKMDKTCETEYGFPSSHSIAAAGLSPYLCYMLVTEIDSLYFKIFIICFTLFHTSSMTLSRLYMGAHSIVDCIAGYSLGLIAFAFFVRYGDSYYNWVIEKDFTYTSTVLILATLSLLYCYPFPEKYTTAFGDSAASICVLLGISLASNVHAHNNMLEFFSKSSSHLEHGFVWMFGIVIARLLVGYFIIFATRLIFKSLTLSIVHRMTSLDPETKDSYTKEVPTKLVVYSMIGWNCVYTVPLIFAKLGLN
eukprot:gene3365-5912_t